jgi:hypothetical protein
VQDSQESFESATFAHLPTSVWPFRRALCDMSRSAQYCQSNWAILLVSQKRSCPPNQTACPLEPGL